MNYYPFHIGDYLSATRHLSWAEDAAYRRLLDTYYTTEKPLPADLRAVCRLVLATTDEQREAVRVVLDEFFSLTEEGWRNSRADEEIAAMKVKQEKQREKANKRWHKPEHEHGNASAMPRHEAIDAAASKAHADAMPPTPTPTPTPKEEIHTPTPRKRGEARVVHPGFDDFWSAYPRKTAKPDAAKVFTRLNPDAELLGRMLAAIAEQATWPQWTKDGGQFIPHPATWLNQARWEDQQPATAAPQRDRFAGAI